VPDRVSEYLYGLGIPHEGLRDWTLEVAQHRGEDVAIIATKGCEIHFVALDEAAHRTVTRKNLRRFLAPLIERYGYATTRVPVAVTDHRLREKLGFVELWRDETFAYFVVADMPYSRKAP
jgi:hypothetical protein